MPSSSRPSSARKRRKKKLNPNDISAIRTGLAGYIGALASSLEMDNVPKHQVIAGILTDEVKKLSQLEADSFYCEPAILIPVFNLMKGVLTQQCQALLKDSHGEDIGIRIPRYKAMIEEFNHLIEVNTSKGE